MQVMELFNVLWEKITMGFIIKLLNTKNPMIKFYYNSIMVVIDKLINCFHFVLFKVIFDAK